MSWSRHDDVSNFQKRGEYGDRAIWKGVAFSRCHGWWG